MPIPLRHRVVKFLLRRPLSLPYRALQYARNCFTRKKIRRAVLSRFPNVVHVGTRAVCKRLSIHGKPYIKKTFSSSTVGQACLERELAAQELFRGSPWLAPVAKKEGNWLLFPWYPPERRLDHLAGSLDEQERFEVARQAIQILLDIFLKGYAHRDFHSENLFLLDGQLIVTDFEVLEAQPEDARPAFPRSYDITGVGLDSPFKTMNMCYTADDPRKKSLRHVLGIPISRVLEGIEQGFKEQLRLASTTFQTHRRRHTCRAQRIYGSFALPHLTVTKSEAQRDSARRLDNFRIQDDALRGNTVLDLGSNIGGMVFELQKLKPGRCVGVEFDLDKVELATKVAAYNGLNNLSFVHANIDKLNIESVGGPFDVVFCLAIEAHIKKRRRLYRLLSQATRETLYFEGNATTDIAEVRTYLLENGFRSVEHLGVSDDDCIPDNNRRHLLAAQR